MMHERLHGCVTPALLLVGLLVIGCGRKAPESLPAPAHGDPAPAQADDKPAPAAVAVPTAATAGDVLPPLPTPAPLLASGPDAAPLLPTVSCVSLAPDREYKLGTRVEVVRNPTKTGDAAGTLELCLFHRWMKRPDDELARRTGRLHHFVAAFPGDEVAAWTSDDMERTPANARPESALPPAAGWSALIATGIPARPALAVASARFYDGPLGEELHWRRQARVLVHSKGRWAWRPLASRDFTSLDTVHLQAACGAEEAEADRACLGADEQVEAARRDAAQRGELRQARLAGQPDPGAAGKRKRGKAKKALGERPSAYHGDGDPQSAWLRDGRLALNKGKWRLALDHALRVDMVCGEPVREGHELIAAALAKGGLKADKTVPLLRTTSLCEPLHDKAGPKREK